MHLSIQLYNLNNKLLVVYALMIEKNNDIEYDLNFAN